MSCRECVLSSCCLPNTCSAMKTHHHWGWLLSAPAAGASWRMLPQRGFWNRRLNTDMTQTVSRQDHPTQLNFYSTSFPYWLLWKCWRVCSRRNPLNKDASLYFSRWFGSIGMESVQTTCLEVNTSECPARNPDFGLFWTIWEISWLKWVEDLETKGGRLKKFTLLKSWGPRSSSIIDRDRGKANIVGSRDGETSGMCATIIAFLTHWPLTTCTLLQH